ncbi:MAG: hypothetical protein Harvfovirus5_15 [Harvfovirus sp.]|uniref:Uncharacterized protein n=1 Tax=Harvfovirus sp. TaxID=2487768 RepID=A0A3G5A3E8_9VIRU|nr:MAG: hypothetical protein Harvfovirus5_15 [Harvfovirus sp.]
MSLKGFYINEFSACPVYNKIECQICLLPFRENGKIPLRNFRDVLDKTSDEILSMRNSDLEEILKIPEICSCSVDVDSDSDVEYVEQDSKRLFNNSLKCCCGKNFVTKALLSDSWSCPFCGKIACDPMCFIKHIGVDHPTVKTGMEAPTAVLGGMWCPLCRTIVAFGAVEKGDQEWRESITEEELLFKVHLRCGNKNKKSVVHEYAIANVLCYKCFHWDDKCLPTPTWFEGAGPLYPIDTDIPRYVSVPKIRMSQILHESRFDSDSLFICDLLKREYCEGVCDEYLSTVSVHNPSGMFIWGIWNAVFWPNPGTTTAPISSPDEVKKNYILGTKLLETMRTDIAALNNALSVTNLLPVLIPLISNYLWSNLVNFEKILSKIHSDVVRYAPLIAAILNKLRKIE